MSDSEDVSKGRLGGDAHVCKVTFDVAYDYRVVFTRGCFSPDNPTLAAEIASDRDPRAILAVVDAGLADANEALVRQIASYVDAYAPKMRLVADPLVIVGGETAKNDPRVLQTVIEALATHRLDRHGYCVAVGGGAVLDVVGFAAATVHRGVRLIRVPSTVLAQNDAGVGVKNGVNAFGQKNFLGCFAPPDAVINDAQLLETLSARDRRAGIAEAVKVALIRDRDYFEWLRASAARLARFEAGATEDMIRRAAELHLEHIACGGDPFERGSARPLDFGHWLAHKLEGLTDHALRHGEAVAIGMAVDTLYSCRKGWLAQGYCDEVLALLRQLGLPTFHPALQWVDAAGVPIVEQGLNDFREHLGGELTVTYLKSIGQEVTVHEVDLALVRACVEELSATLAPEPETTP